MKSYKAIINKMFVVMHEQTRKTISSLIVALKELTSDFWATAADPSNEFIYFHLHLQGLTFIKPLVNEVHWCLVINAEWNALLLANYPAYFFKTTHHNLVEALAKGVSKGLQRDFSISLFTGRYTLHGSHEYVFSCTVVLLYIKRDQSHCKK